MSTYDWTQFHVHMYYLAPLDEVFARFRHPGWAGVVLCS